MTSRPASIIIAIAIIATIPLQSAVASDSFKVAFEAEDYTSKTPSTNRDWVEVSHSLASNGFVMQALPDQSVAEPFTGNTPSLDFDVTLSAPGTYYIWLRGAGNDGGANSLHLGVNGQPLANGPTMAISSFGLLGWQGSMNTGLRASFVASSSGVYTINVRMREDGAYVDRLIVTDDVDYDPSGLIEIEAEVYTAPATGPDYKSTAFYRVRDSSASGGVALAGLADSSPTGFPFDLAKPHDVNFDVTFEEPGTYYIWVRGRGPNGAGDSVHLGINGTPLSPYSTMDFTTGTDFAATSWTRTVVSGANSGNATVTLSTPGTRTLNVQIREDGVLIDKIILTRSSTFNAANAESLNTSEATALAEGKLYKGELFSEVHAEYMGVAASRPNSAGFDTINLPPSVMYDPEDGSRPYKMWWACTIRPGDTLPGGAPLPPALATTDGICFAHSLNGESWSTPQLVLAPRGGGSSSFVADDHLVGEPSVLKLDGQYVMFYEAYGNWLTVIRRFFSLSHTDTWTTHGLNDPDPELEGYLLDGNQDVLGIVPKFKSSRPSNDPVEPVYSCQVVYSFGKRNRYLSKTPCPVEPDGTSDTYSALNNGVPIFWVYKNPGSQSQARDALYSCFDGANSNSFVSLDSGCEGVPPGFPTVLGYATRISAISSGTNGDLKGSLRNFVMMATSSDGVNWVRFAGGAYGGAVLEPDDLFTMQYFHNCSTANPLEKYDIHRVYGSGFPVALVRDSYLEVYFTDDSDNSVTPTSICKRSDVLNPTRVVIPVSDWDVSSAYANATRETGVRYGRDLKWSPMTQRYVNATEAFTVPGTNITAPTVEWSQLSSSVFIKATYRSQDHIEPLLPTGSGRKGGSGGILGTALGHVVEDSTTGYMDLRLYFPGFPDTLSDVNSGTKIEQIFIDAIVDE